MGSTGPSSGRPRLVDGTLPPDGFDRAAAQLRDVLKVGHFLATVPDEQSLLELITATARATLGYGACALALRGDDGSFTYRTAAGPAKGDEHDLCSRVMSASAFEALRHAAIRLGGVYLVPASHAVRDREDVRLGIVSSGVSVPPRSWQAGSLLFAPLFGTDGGAVGFLNPDDPLSGDLPDREQALMLETLAELTVVGLEIIRARSKERAALALAETQRRQLEALMTASAQVRGEAALDEVLRGIASAMSSGGGFRRVAIYVLVDGRKLEVRATAGLDPHDDQALRANSMALSELEPAMRPDMLVSRSYLLDHRRFELPAELSAKLCTPATDPEWRDGRWHAEDMLTVPLVARSGEVLGLISLDEPNDGLLPDRAHVQALEFFADQCAAALVSARQLEAVRAEACTDMLTGLANRRALVDAVERAVSRRAHLGEPATLLFIDIDHFKPVNDTYGHSVGDEVLQRIAQDLRDRLRRGDLLARYGGEEFVALLPNTAVAPGARIAEALRKRIASLDVTELIGVLPIRISIGVSALAGRNDSADAVLQSADAAMYEAKRRGRDQVVVAEG